MKRLISIALTALFLTGINACKDAGDIKKRAGHDEAAKKEVAYVAPVPPEGLGEIVKLEPQEFQKILGEATLVDIRTPEEFAEGHLKGAVLINYKKRTFPDYINVIDKEKPVAIYCRSANRSGKAAYIMQNLGFKKVYDLAGGIKAWKKAGLPIETTDNDANKAIQEKLKNGDYKGRNLAGEFHQVGVDEFEKLIKSGEVTLVDCRTPEEFAESHIDGAINIDWKHNRHFIDDFKKQITNAKPVAIYCRSGNRSTRAMFALGAVGYSKIYNLEHGIKSWKKAGKPLVEKKKEEKVELAPSPGGEEGC